MQHLSHRAIVLLAMLSMGAAHGQRSGRLNPPHLSEMPLPARVAAEITAAHPRDAAARRMGAFQQLQDIIEELSGGRTAIGRETPDEARILGEYRQANYEALRPFEDQANRDPDFLRYMRRFENDPGLRDEILNRFFSPALRAQSQAVTRQLQARLAAVRQQAPAFGGTPQQAPVPTLPKQAPATPATPAAPRPPLPPDPSIARAKAAGVDTKVFGMQLGDRLALPTCGLLELGGPVARTCTSDMVNSIANAVASLGSDSVGTIITLAKANCPAWMSACTVTGTLDDSGRLIGISARTDGYAVGQDAVRELAAKYGSRYGKQQRFHTRTDTGAKFEVWDPEWDLPGLRVRYYVIDDNVKRGLLLVETEEAYQRRQARIREENRPKL